MSWCRVSMSKDMRHRHIPVKHDYAPAAVFAYTVQPHIERVKNLARIRRDRGLSQQKLADMAGVHQATISKLENGNLNPTLENIVAIADALKVEAHQLFDLPELKARVLAAIDRIPAEKLEAALVVLETMAGPMTPPSRPELRRTSR